MIDRYKNITKEILRIVSEDVVDDVKLANELDKRQVLIDSIQGKVLADFKVKYKSEELNKIDEDIKFKLKNQMFEVRKELSEFKLNKTVNTAYANMNKNNLNIFSKKV